MTASYTELIGGYLMNINNTTDHFEQERYMFSNKLASILGSEWYKECEFLIDKVSKARHLKLLG